MIKPKRRMILRRIRQLEKENAKLREGRDILYNAAT